MASMNSIAHIERLTEDNYELWKIHMKSALVFNDLWSYVDGSEVKTEANQADWLKEDGKALALINMCIFQSQLNHIRKAEMQRKPGSNCNQSLNRKVR